LSDFNETSIFSTDFRKKAQISSFIKIRPAGAKLFHADGQTDMTKLILAFRNFANAPEKVNVTGHDEQRGSRGDLYSFFNLGA
jgi:hypothetical protein